MATRVRKAFRKNLFGIVTMVISAAVLLGFLFSSEGLQSLNQISGNIRFLWLLGAFLAAVFAWVLEGLVLHLFCKKAYPEWKFYFSAITPSSTGGQPMQIYSMRRLGMDTGAAGSIIAMKTLVYQIVLVFYSLAMVVWKLPFFQNHISNFSFVTIIGLLCVYYPCSAFLHQQAGYGSAAPQRAMAFS